MADKDDDEKGKKGGKGKILVLLPTLLLLAAAGWYFFLRSDEPAKVVVPEPVPGAVAKLDPITINLAGGHFLKLGLALQGEASATEVDGSKALDLAIAQFSGETLDDLATEEGRLRAKEELVARVKFAYLPETEEAKLAATEALKEGMDEAPADEPESTDNSSEESAESGSASAQTGAAEETGTETQKKTKKKTKKATASATDSAELSAGQLSGAQVVAAAEALTVVSQVYDVYFTEFVMQ